MPNATASRPAPSGVAPLAAGLIGGYVQNAIARRVARRFGGGGVIQRLVVSILVSWLIGKAVRWGQTQTRQA